MSEAAVPLPIFIVGLPGSGKSRVGKILSRELGVRHIDSDVLIEEAEGRSIGEIFADRGEPYFRALESRIIEGLETEQAVISLGGGAIESPSVQGVLARGHAVWIRADEGELLRRIRRSPRRPLMRRNPKATLQTLAERRNPLFEEVANIQVWTSAGPPQEVADQVMVELTPVIEVTVQGSREYPVLIGTGAQRRAVDLLPSDVMSVFLVYPETLANHARVVEQKIKNTGREVTLFPHPVAELAKTYGVVERGWDAMGEARIGRKDSVVSLGGGATTDMGGFLAATWLRGIANINMPTTLLGMVDAAVGGKTGINTGAGKNLVGSFYDPVAVICDTDYLATLPQADYRGGLAEIIKCGFIADTRILEIFRDNPRLDDVVWATREGATVLLEIIERAVRVKASVVGEDRTEAGVREHLNYGHTLGHAIEKEEGYTLRHGEAVAMGAIFAAELAGELGLLSEEDIELHRTLFGAVGLPTRYEGELSDLLVHMFSDKKVRDGQLRFVVLDGIGNPVVRSVSPNELSTPAERIGLR